MAELPAELTGEQWHAEYLAVVLSVEDAHPLPGLAAVRPALESVDELPLSALAELRSALRDASDRHLTTGGTGVG